MPWFECVCVFVCVDALYLCGRVHVKKLWCLHLYVNLPLTVVFCRLYSRN